MTYTSTLFGHELKQQILEKRAVEDIGRWVYEIFLANRRSVGGNFLEVLDTLRFMELGPEFEFTYEELNQIADDLIAGKEVKL